MHLLELRKEGPEPRFSVFPSSFGPNLFHFCDPSYRDVECPRSGPNDNRRAVVDGLQLSRLLESTRLHVDYLQQRLAGVCVGADELVRGEKHDVQIAAI